ncbi:MAG: glycosyltransferase family 4 protein [Ignavibacteriaceae bacterium]|nr:glycosyltransferase family 4 protein [Ignavibacteriaceae bacterium]
MSSKKKVLITFLGNINYDTRCKNLYDNFSANKFDVEFLGFDWMTDGFSETHGDVSIFKLKKGFLSLSFYLKFIWHIKLKLLNTKASIIFAEDIYTLPFAVIFGKLKRAKIYYDSRELFGYLAGLKEKKIKQAFWKLTEKFFIKKADYVMVTGPMDGEFLKKEYGIKNLILLRNLPRYYKSELKLDLHSHLQIDKTKKIILYQGVLLKGRGIEKIYAVLNELSDHVFVIAGGGEYEEYYKKLAAEMDVNDKVFFLGKLTQEDLPKITASVDIGVSLIENLSISYYHALPNKLFEYIMADVPVIVSDLPQMKEIVDKYDVGFAVDIDNKAELIDALKKLADDTHLYESKKQNCHIASQELNWEKEVTNLLKTLT